MDMKKSKLLRRFAAMVLAGTLAASMGMSVFAGEKVENAEFTKTITKGANDYAPATVFEFSIVPGTAVDGSKNSPAIYAGPAGGAYFAEGADKITSTPNTADIGKTEIKAGKTSISIDETKFTAPGIYRYAVTETAGSYEGVTYTEEIKNFDVYVNSDLKVYAYMFTDTSSNDGKDDGVFENSYDVKDLTIKKTVTGNQGDKLKEFTFTIKVDGADGERYYVTFSDNTAPITLENGVPQKITLSNGESAAIYGLSEKDTYTVTEDDYTTDGYTTKIDQEIVRTKTGSITEDTTVSVVNDRSTTTPTGIITNILPYVMMIAVAVILAFVFLRKRNCNR